MLFCRDCGTQLGDGASFCPGCGEPVNRQNSFKLVSVEVSPSGRPGDSRKVITEVYKLNSIGMVTRMSSDDEDV